MTLKERKMKKIDLYYVGAMCLMAVIAICQGYLEAIFVGVSWILAKKAFKSE